MRDNGDMRGQTSALVDGTLLLDCGPEAPRAAQRQGGPRRGAALAVHPRAPDHTGPAALMWRGWVHTDQPLDVLGPPAVIEECRRWVEPDAPIRWHELRARATWSSSGLPRCARSPPTTVTRRSGRRCSTTSPAPTGERMLWATDTAPLPQVTLDMVMGAAYDAVFLEQTNGDDLDTGTDHLDLRSWPLQVAELRRRGAVTDRTRLVPIHLGHGNPPPPQLRVAWRVGRARSGGRRAHCCRRGHDT